MAKAKSSKSSKPKFDVYQVITDRILTALKKGTRPWQRSWVGGGHGMGAPLRHNGVPYKGLNVWLLMLTAEEKGYVADRWMTLNQANKFGGLIRKGEKATMVFYNSKLSKPELDAKGKPVKNAQGEDKEKSIWLARAYSVFNVEQIDDLPERFYPKPVVEIDPARAKIERIEAIEAYFAKVGAKVEHKGNSAFYRPDEDFIRMPDFQDFKDAEHYYGTLAHEHIHWTGAESRLNRDFTGNRFGNEAYAMEELVAEMGAAFITNHFGIEGVTREDHESYLGHWVKVLSEDKHAIFTASTKAQRAVEYLHGLAGVKEVEAEPEVDAADGVQQEAA